MVDSTSNSKSTPPAPDGVPFLQLKPDEYILVIDDDWMNREVIEAYLQTAGYKVVTANGGEKGLEIAFEKVPALVVLDINMPGMNGLEVCQRLKNNPLTKFTPVMVITALEADADKLKAIEAGADDFLTKPFNSLIMMTRVKSLLRIKNLSDELADRNALLRRVLSRYVDEDITETILSDPEKHLKLGGSSRKVTVFFCDVRGFTHFAENHPAQTVVEVLNRLFAELTPSIYKYHGTFDKYNGDEIMGFFGAPVSTDNDALNAVKTAVEMQYAFAKLRKEIARPNIAELGIGIGLHTGEAAVGNVGYERVMNYTVIGDTVNLAHRLQQIARAGQILISADTYEEVADHVRTEALAPLMVAGKTRPIMAYRVLGIKTKK
jgi:class 3 adenylate cyclase